MRPKSSLVAEEGKVLIRAFLAIVMVLLVGVAALKGLKYLYHYYDLRNQVAYLARFADIEAEGELRKRVAARAKRTGVDFDEREIVVDRSPGYVRIELPYREGIDLTFLGKRFRLFSVPGRAVVGRRVSETMKSDL